MTSVKKIKSYKQTKDKPESQHKSAQNKHFSVYRTHVFL